MDFLTKEQFEAFAAKEFPGKATQYTDTYGFIQAGTIMGSELHYEFYKGTMQLHIEGGHWKPIRDYLIHSGLKEESAVRPDWWGRNNACWILDNCISSSDDLKQAFLEISRIIDPFILGFEESPEGKKLKNEIWKPIVDSTLVLDLTLPAAENELEVSNNDVSLYDITLLDLLNISLHIPDYQRIYCWRERNVNRLLEDIYTVEGEYRLGSVILQRKDGFYDIIDGQQRMVTLSILLSELGVKGIKLLDEKFSDTRAIEYVKYNRFLIQSFLRKNKEVISEERTLQLLKNLTFFILVLNSSSIDLAYTFFSNENTRGEALTDYDLLKAHHLRYIDQEQQTRNLARRWNQMLLNSGDDKYEKPHYRVLDLYLFRLRKWMRKQEWNQDEENRIKNEYSAAPIIDDIPPFGEKFDYYEPIQGGAHFFGYVDMFVAQFEAFKVNPQVHYEEQHSELASETHWFYRDIIEAFLFAYYLKFGEMYINEAMILISLRVAHLRLGVQRADFNKLLQRADETEITMMIDQASSPTFFLQELLTAIRNLNYDMNVSGIRARFIEKLKKVLRLYPSSIKSINSIKDRIIDGK